MINTSLIKLSAETKQIISICEMTVGGTRDRDDITADKLIRIALRVLNDVDNFEDEEIASCINGHIHSIAGENPYYKHEKSHG